MEKAYVTTQSFWMFVAGVVVGLLVVLATMMALSTQKDGQASLYRFYTPTVDYRSGISPTYTTTDAVSGISPTYTTTDTVSGISPTY